MAKLKPKCSFPKPQDVEKVARKAIGVKLPPELDSFVRSLPNKSEWLRQAIADAYQREINSSSS